jgi:DNA-binding beta-propeller fold protein YncE
MANKVRMSALLVAAAAAFWAVSPPAASQAAAPLRLIQTIALPGVQGRLDHLAVDTEARRLFLAALGANSVEVIDLRSQKVESIKGFRKPQGIYYAARPGRLFVANGDDGACRVLWGDPLKINASIPLKLGADLMDYDPAARLLYVGHGGKDAGETHGEIAVIDAASLQVVRQIQAPAHPGGLLVEPGGPRLFATIPETDQVLSIQRSTGAILSAWKMTAAQQPVSLAYDAGSKRLFVGTRRPPRIIVVDPATGRPTADFASASVMDGLFFDPAARRLYASGGDGEVVVHRQDGPDHYSTLATIPTRPVARTSLFVPAWKRLFVALPAQDTEVARIQVYEIVQ